MTSKILITAILVTACGHATDLRITTAVGIKHVSNQKMVEVVANENLSYNWFVGASLGAFNRVNFLTNNWSPNLGVHIGYGVANDVAFGEATIGLGAINRTTRNLSTHYQITNSVTFGVKHNSASLGITYKHWSNGQGSNNRGADYVGITIGRSI